jgi:hypothetical protein
MLQPSAIIGISQIEIPGDSTTDRQLKHDVKSVKKTDWNG